jgi:hypothetical protein
MSNLKSFSNMINIRQILIGAAGLLIGTLVYLVDRPPDQAYFIYSIPFNISLFKTLPNLFGHIGNSLPSFIHAFSFILLTAGIISCRKKGFLIVCLGWFSIDCVFELGQKFSSLILKIIPNWFSSIPFLENTRNYFLHGTFDFNDIAAITIGTLIAYFVLLTTIKNERRV